MSDPNALSAAAGFAQTAEDLRRAADAIRRRAAEAAAGVYQASSPEGEITVETDGRPRVRAVHIDPRAMRLERPALSQLLVETLNAGILAGRTGSANAVLESVDPELRGRVAEAAARAQRSRP